MTRVEKKLEKIGLTLSPSEVYNIFEMSKCSRRRECKGRDIKIIIDFNYVTFTH
jgi:hypothetical protein